MVSLSSTRPVAEGVGEAQAGWRQRAGVRRGAQAPGLRQRGGGGGSGRLAVQAGCVCGGKARGRLREHVTREWNRGGGLPLPPGWACCRTPQLCLDTGVCPEAPGAARGGTLCSICADRSAVPHPGVRDERIKGEGGGLRCTSAPS